VVDGALPSTINKIDPKAFGINQYKHQVIRPLI
jgi:hypothetical protein